MKREKDWFRIKKYPHIGLPLKPVDRPWVAHYVADPVKVEQHAFYPLIHRNTVVRKFRKSIDKKTGQRSELRFAKSKERELYYANHLDACIYSYFAKQLNLAYEKKLDDLGLKDTVTAYRRIPFNPANPNSPNKSSADFAAQVFSFIIGHSEGHLVAITFDIKGFFDNLDHLLLKKAWYEVNGQNTLSGPEYNIFKSVTNFSYINENQLFEACKNTIITETKTGIQKRKAVKRFRHLKDQRAIAFCDLDEIQKLRRAKLIVGNQAAPDRPKRLKGIPQGTPISAALANVYMLHFDQRINEAVKPLDGIYRRYSDDMIVICPECHATDMIRLFDKAIAERLLEIQHDKTQVFKFDRLGGKFQCSQQYETKLHPHKNLEYLGFEFDGQRSYLKSSSLASYYRKMKKGIERSRYYSKSVKKSKSLGQIFQTRLYKKFTYHGAKRRRIYVKDKSDPTKWIKTESFNWGNYISYAHLAMNKLPNNRIKHQISRHWSILNQLIK
ncbi:MAG: polymerase [Mucilaginibacter sp.]|nr:polymerase [Mucilaginibacter sp.]